MFQRHRMILKRGMAVGLAGVAGITRLGEQGRIGQLGNARLRLTALPRRTAFGHQAAAIEQNQRQRQHTQTQRPPGQGGAASSDSEMPFHQRMLILGFLSPLAAFCRTPCAGFQPAWLKDAGWKPALQRHRV